MRVGNLNEPQAGVDVTKISTERLTETLSGISDRFGDQTAHFFFETATAADLTHQNEKAGLFQPRRSTATYFIKCPEAWDFAITSCVRDTMAEYDMF